MHGAGRLPLRPRCSIARRALLLFCFSLALLGASPGVTQEISGAEYITPTRAYPHGALGDELEWAAVRITVSRQTRNGDRIISGHLNLTYDIGAPREMVFEDIAPRLWDIDGDGSPEVVVVLSHQNFGAQLAVIAYRGGEFNYLAATPLIGTRFRWLAPVGAADLDGDGHVEVAFILTPHLSKTLQIWRYRDGAFRLVAHKAGLTNHRIGWNHIPGGLRDCGGAVELITANADWSRIVASRLESGSIQSREVAAYTGPESLNAALDCS